MTARPYKHTRRRGRTVDVHVLVWTTANGPVPEGHVVHHKNHVKHDNRLENLQLMTHEEHSRHHNDKHARTRACESCGTQYTPAATKRGRSRTCSPQCFRDLVSTNRAGSGNGQAKLTEQQVVEIRHRAATGEMQKALAAEFDISPMTVSNIVNRQTWRHVV